MVHRQGEHDICADLSGMKLAVKTAKLNRVVAMEETMEIEKVVTAVMVVTVAVTAISGVPDFLKLRKGSRLFLVHTLHQIGVHLFAVTHALRLDLKCFVEQIISAGDEVNEIADTPNFLTHKSMANNRTVRQYYVENSHPAIVNKETWKLVQNKIAAEHKRKTGA